MAEVQSALNDYWAELDASDLSEASKGIYMANADNFVRWMRDDFTPGSRNTPWRPSARSNSREKLRQGNSQSLGNLLNVDE